MEVKEAFEVFRKQTPVKSLYYTHYNSTYKCIQAIIFKFDTDNKVQCVLKLLDNNGRCTVEALAKDVISI